MLASWICRTPRFLGGEQMWLRDGHRHACDRATHTRTHARTHARAHTHAWLTLVPKPFLSPGLVTGAKPSFCDGVSLWGKKSEKGPNQNDSDKSNCTPAILPSTQVCLLICYEVLKIYSKEGSLPSNVLPGRHFWRATLPKTSEFKPPGVKAVRVPGIAVDFEETQRFSPLEKKNRFFSLEVALRQSSCDCTIGI